MYYPPYQPDYYAQQAQRIANGFQPPMNPPQIVSFSVSSIDEARSARIDNPMNTYVFLDGVNGKVYTKRIGDNGAAVLQQYTLDNPPTPMTDAERIAALETRLAEYEKGSVT